MSAVGLTQSAISEALGVPKATVARWLQAQAIPGPNNLLQLGKLLGLNFSELVLVHDPHAPRVAFRKMKGTKTQDYHIEKAQDIGRHLRCLVPYFPFDIEPKLSVLDEPTCDYAYLHYETSRVRTDIGLGLRDVADFKDLIRCFGQLKAVVVPVLWGSKQRHENAVHIYLPDSKSTWVYLNLDTNTHDFKFWMAHELGHCLSPSLTGDDAEDFADAFAASLLFPHELVEVADSQVRQYGSASARIKAVLSFAKDYVISPYTVAQRLEQYAVQLDKTKLQMGSGFHGAVTNFNKGFRNLSQVLFQDCSLDDSERPMAQDYIKYAEAVFETPFFKLLKSFLTEYEKGPSFIEVVLDMSSLDAKSLHSEMV